MFSTTDPFGGGPPAAFEAYVRACRISSVDFGAFGALPVLNRFICCCWAALFNKASKSMFSGARSPLESAVAAAVMGANMDKNSSHPPALTSVVMNLAVLFTGLMTCFFSPSLFPFASFCNEASACIALIGSPAGKEP